MLKRWIKKIDKRIIFVIISWTLFIKNSLPLLIISKYNHSNADDYWMSSDAHFVWEKTHSLWETIIQGYKSAVYLWKYWDGCFLSMFFGGLPPVVFHEDYYKYTFIILAGSLTLGLMVFLFVLLVRVFKFHIFDYLCICPLILLVFLNMSPSIKDAFYWWVGGTNYTLLFSFFFFAQAFVLEFYISKRITFLIIGSILSFFVGIGNLLSGLVNPLVLILEYGVYIFITNKSKKINKNDYFILGIPSLCGIAGLLVNVLAPGNMIRGGSELFAANPFEAIWGAIVASINLIPTFYRKPMVTIIIFITVVVWYALDLKKINFDFKLPVVFITIMFAIYCAAFTPVVYAGSAYYGRCKNVSFGLLMIVCLSSIIYVCGWIKAKISEKRSEKIKIAIFCIAGFLLLFACHKNEIFFDGFIAKQSLEIGQAQDFDRKVDERFKKYYDTSIREVVVEPIDWIPPIFYWDDDCLQDLEYYFHKDYIRVIQ